MQLENKQTGIRNCVSQLRNQIYLWLKNLYKVEPSSVKNLFTIKDEHNLKILQKIMTIKNKQKPLTTQQIIEGGFGLTNTTKQTQISIYFRNKYKHKFYSKQNKQKNTIVQKLAQQLYHNLVVSRTAPRYYSISFSFLPQLYACMDELSEKNNKSLWFNLYQAHSLAQWIVYMFENQIIKAYRNYRNWAALKKQNKKLNPYPPSFYQYVKNNYADLNQIKQIIQKTIIKNFMNDQVPQSQNYYNKIKFMVTKNFDRVLQAYDKFQYLIQFRWYLENHTNQSFQIFKKVAEVLNQNYKKWVQNKPFEEFQEEQQREIERQRKKRMDKRKKQKQKKQKNKQIQQQDQQENINQIKKNLKIQQTENQQTKTQQRIILNQQKQQQRSILDNTNIQKLQTQAKNSQIQNKQQKKGKKIKKTQPKQQKKENKTSIFNATKKIIRQRINQYYEFFVNQLTQASSMIDKYRKIVYDVLYDFLQNQVMAQIKTQFPRKNEQQNNITQDFQWKLQVYGSASAGFSLRHSDIDLVVLADKNKISLPQIMQKITLKQWAIQKKYIQAQIPIITLKINLYNSTLAKKLLTSKQYKRIQNQLFSVDMTLSQIGQPHSGILNTNQLKQIFQIYPSIRSICILLKQYFRIRNLNKPYTGGIGSYVLIILIQAILTKKSIIQLNKHHQISDQYRMIKQVSIFMQQQFIPFETVISNKKNCNIKADPSLHLNITNPISDQLLKTSAFHIEQIIYQLKRLREFQQNIENQLYTMNLEQKKNMKNYFLENFREFMYNDAL